MCNVLRTITLVLAAALFCGTAAAQSCPALATAGLDPGADACAANCCSALNSCYGANGCSMSTDWPTPVSAQCAQCNQSYLTCTGFCFTTDAYRTRYLNHSGSSGCRPDCSGAPEFAICGRSNGCGGFCTADSWCGLLVRRPEFVAVLF